MLRRILLAAIPAGLIAGAALTAVQAVGVLPLIHEAERYERAADAARAGAIEGEPLLSRRLAFTAVANGLLGIAFGLLLTAGMTLQAGMSAGGGVDARRGLPWGLAGFAAFALAPALGLPPELPGTHAAPLAARQVWWWATVALTAGGLGLVLLSGRMVWAVVGTVLLALPHAVGAPQPAEPGGTAPEHLTRAFVPVTLLASFGFWALLGALAGDFYRRLDSR